MISFLNDTSRSLVSPAKGTSDVEKFILENFQVSDTTSTSLPALVTSIDNSLPESSWANSINCPILDVKVLLVAEVA